MIDVTWVPIEGSAFAALYHSLADQLHGVGSRTAPDGDEFSYRGVVMTQWGLLDADAPLLKHEKRAQNDPPYDTENPQQWEHRYWVACVKEGET